jgi:thioesterase domain-containing protein
MAQQLRAAGQEVALLALLDTKAPGYPEFPAWPLRAAAHLHTYLKAAPNDRREYLRVRVRGVRDQVRRRTLLLLLRQRAGAVDRALDDIGIQHIHAAYSYTRDQYPGKITLLRAEVQPIGCRPEPTNGWSRYALDGVEVLPVPGEHATIVEEPHVRELARQLQGALGRASGGVGRD